MRRPQSSVLICAVALVWLVVFPTIISTQVQGSLSVQKDDHKSTDQKKDQKCKAKDPAKKLECLQANQPTNSSAGKQVTEFFQYNKTAKGHLNKMSEVKGWEGPNSTTTTTTTTFTYSSSSSSAPATATLNGRTLIEIYRTDHWIWFSDPTIYDQNRAYIDPLLNWPETSYIQIAQWLALTLPPGSFDGGRRAIFVDPNSGYFGWAGGGNIGLGYQDFKDIPDWPWVVIPHETTNMFTGEGVTGGWPTDWWADGRSPFPAMVAVNVEKAYNVSYWQQHDAADSHDPQYAMFRDLLQAKYDWTLFQIAFANMRNDGVNLANIHSEFESANWYGLHYLKSHTVAFYLSNAAGVDLSATLDNGTVGTPPPAWSDVSFAPYQIDLASVVPVDQIQPPSGTKKGAIALSATASDPDWGVRDVSFWWSTDNNVFKSIGSSNATSASISWDTTSVIPSLTQVWIMSISTDLSGFESPWSISSTFTVDNNPSPTDFSLTNSGGVTVTQGNSASNTITATTASGPSLGVGLSCASGVPTGASCSFNPTSGTTPFSSTLAISTSSSTPSGSYSIVVSASGGGVLKQTQFTLTVSSSPPPAPTFDFSLSTSGGVSVTQGSSGSNKISALLASGAAQSVTLSCSSGLPSGASCAFNPSTANPAFTSSLTVATSASTPSGTYMVTVSGAGGGYTRTTQFTLTVNSAPFNFSISNDGSITVTQGATASMAITTKLLSGQTQGVTLTCSGLPAGVSCSFTPVSGSPPFSSSVRVTTSTSTPAGSYQITITGTGGTVSRTVGFTLKVNPIQPPPGDQTSQSTNTGTTSSGSSQNPTQALQTLTNRVQGLEKPAGLLDKGKVHDLTEALKHVADDLSKNHNKDARHQLDDFIHKVQDLVKDKKLTVDQGQTLINAARAIQSAIPSS